MKQVFCNRIGWAALALALALPIAVLADLSSTQTLTASQSLNLDTGATAASGGDILWSGTSMIPQGTAKAGVVPGLTGASGFASLDQSTLQALSSSASSSAIPSSSLSVGTVFGVFTNAGHPSKVLVTASSATSITLQFTTFGATSGSGPIVTKVLNNSSEIPDGFPNSGIAQGSVFKVLGSGLATAGDEANLHSSEGSGLQTTLNGATVTVTVGSVTKQAPLYYATPAQIDGVLSSSMPLGSGTLTVSYNGVTSATFPIQVVAAAPGITIYNGSGIAQHVNGTLVTYTASAAPGEVIIIWGTGFGATGNSDTTYDTSAHQTSVPYKIYFGGVEATNIAYKGASVYPGVDVFGVTVPANAPTGCFVPVVAVANGNIVSNTTTIAINAAGGMCSDSQLAISGDQISTLNGQGTVKSGFLSVYRSTPVNGVTNSAFALFRKTIGVSSPFGGGIVSIACTLTQTVTGASIAVPIGLNAGTITVTGPVGSPLTLTPQSSGIYIGALSTVPSTGGAYVFNGSGGTDVGGFSTTVSFPNPFLVWTNQSAAATVGRNQGLTVSWSGGAPGSYVIISGASDSGTVSGSFNCLAPQSAGTFTVPSYILLGLPAGSGTTTVQNATNLGTFSASGLDFGRALAALSFTVSSNYN